MVWVFAWCFVLPVRLLSVLLLPLHLLGVSAPMANEAHLACIYRQSTHYDTLLGLFSLSCLLLLFSTVTKQLWISVTSHKSGTPERKQMGLNGVFICRKQSPTEIVRGDTGNNMLSTTKKETETELEAPRK